MRASTPAPGKTLSLAMRTAVLPLVFVWIGGCESGDPTKSPTESTASPTTDTAIFRDVAAAADLDFVHFNGMSGNLYFVEPVGSGGALFDYDNDGDLDVYLVQGTMLPTDRPLNEALFPRPAGTVLRDQLFRNDLIIGPDDSPIVSFTNVTPESRIVAPGYGMGVAAGDYDNDGWVDLYVTNFGANQLWKNNGDGSFADVTDAAGADRDGWSTSSSWFDYNRDGWLDLFVVQYVDFRLRNHKTCRGRSGRPDYCGPQSYNGLPDLLLKNRADGTFEDVTAEAGLLLHPSSGLGVVSVDVNRDGWMDLYVANDLRRNFLWMNRQDGTFEDLALITGVAVSSEGKAEASMGIAAADVDNDGDDDLFLTHLMDGTNTLYRNDGSGQFEDHSRQSGLGASSLAFTGFGTGVLDYDSDGWLDIVAFNGSVFRLEEQVLEGDPYPLGQRNQLFRNLAGQSFEEVDDTGPAFDLLEVSRGLAIGDVDNDGDHDLLQVNNNGPVRLLINQLDATRPWIGLRLVTLSSSDALGSRVRLQLPDGSSVERRAHSDGSYCSSNDPRVLFHLASDSLPSSIQVFWPDGAVEAFSVPTLFTYQTLVQGSGAELDPGL